jgi:malonyl-CoA O-methyltransferase
VRIELLARLDELRIEPQAVLDLGAGTGHATRALKRRFPQALTVAVDIAPGMLARARSQSRWLRRFERVRADAYSLPFRDQAFQLVFSSLMLQWCDDLDAVFAEIHRVLAPGGLLLFSTFGPGTLGELREAWAASDAQLAVADQRAGNHVNHFFDPHALGSALMHAGFAEPVLDVDRIVSGYPDTLTLMRELKAIGAHNVTRGRTRGLTGRRRLAAMTRAYEELRRNGQLPATYEVIHGVCWGGARAGRADFPRESMIPANAIRKRGRS